MQNGREPEGQVVPATGAGARIGTAIDCTGGAHRR